MAKKIFDVEIALVTLLDNDRQWFKSCIGLNATETPRNISFCGHAIHGEGLFVVNDATKDERFHDNPLVAGDPKIRFYAGQPLTNEEGFRIGTLCVISPHPRDITRAEIDALEDLGKLAETALGSRNIGETQQTLLEELDKAKREAMIDPLSGLWNRRGVDELFDREIARASRVGESVAIVMTDLDHFKQINDNFGHSKGDEAIRLAADILKQNARPYDIVGRYGGEEFVTVFQGVDFKSLPSFGEKLLQSFRTKARLTLEDGKPHPFTTSFGLTAAAPTQQSPVDRDTLLRAADSALYKAKSGGRNRFGIVDISEIPPTKQEMSHASIL